MFHELVHVPCYVCKCMALAISVILDCICLGILGNIVDITFFWSLSNVDGFDSKTLSIESFHRK